jgi:hypothetical protein
MQRNLAALLAISAIAFGLTSCKTYTSGLKGTSEAGSTAETSFEDVQAMWLTDRGTKDGVLRIVDALKGIVAAEPEHQDALTLLSRSVYFLADGYTDDPEAKGTLFEEGVTYGERAMACDSEFKARIEKGDKPADAVFALQKDDQMAIYWTASNLGKWARGQGFSTLVKYKGYVAKMMTHALALDETAYYGGPPRYWGAFYSIAPGFAGGDMTKSREMYEKAKAMYPEYFATYVLYADTYAVKVQDKALFKELLQYVLDTPSDVLPEMLPEQNVEKQKAQRLLDNIDELFAE